LPEQDVGEASGLPAWLGYGTTMNVPPGYIAAGPNGQFTHVGVGVLQRPDNNNAYNWGTAYAIVSEGTTTVTVPTAARNATFVQQVPTTPTGYGYEMDETI
jgi:hypothetical protein